MIKQFFRFELDLRSLAALRIALGLLVLWDLVLRLRDLTAFYTDDGLLPRITLLEIPHPTLFNFFHTVGSREGVLVWFAFMAVAALGFTVGWRTRTCAVVVWVLHTALKHRNPLILHAGDLELGLILWWCLFLPLSARYSVDARSNPKWAELPNKYSSVATTGYVLQISLMYFMAALHKNDPVWTEQGTALYYCLSYDQFATDFGRYLSGFPSVLRPLTFLTLGLEFGVPLLLWMPWKRHHFRKAACVALLLLHLGIASTLHLGLMPLINMVALLGLWPGAIFGFFAGRIPPFRVPSVSLEGSCPNLELPLPVRGLLVLICVYICHLNYAVYNSVIVPKPIKYFGYIFRQQQEWKLFAPHPGVGDGWFVIEGTCVNGEMVDLFQDGEKPSQEKPTSVASTFPNQRWRLWMLNLTNRRDEKVNLSFATYLARHWNDRHRLPQRVTKIRILFMSEPTPLPGEPLLVTPITFYEFECPEELYKRVDEAYIP